MVNRLCTTGIFKGTSINCFVMIDDFFHQGVITLQ